MVLDRSQPHFEEDLDRFPAPALKAGRFQDLFYREGWEYILEKHGGRLPVKIKALKSFKQRETKWQALPEGTAASSFRCPSRS